ncbi:MAG: hypothetical protein KatS3mg129_3300 [Leptospiraceae bacterium]|nr:MAG: hypothetical protein KatS3mg129_3300 [Leptospiraceae bacterium]
MFININKKLLLVISFFFFIFSVKSEPPKGVGGNIFQDSKKSVSFNSEEINFQKDKEVPVPELTGRVVDLTGTLTDYQIRLLSKKLEALEKEKGSQVVVLIVPTTGIETIEEYSIKVAEKWKIGRAGIDDGVILLIAKNDRKLRIEVGYGLEGAIPDAIAKRIIDEIIVPEFKKGNFFVGIDKGTDAIITLIKGEELPLPEKKQSIEDFGEWIFWAPLIFSFILHLIIGAFLAVLISIILFNILGIFFYGFSLEIFFIIVIASILGVSWYRFSGGSSSGSGGWSGSSGGGFSGGGGSFGGGGASGSW